MTNVTNEERAERAYKALVAYEVSRGDIWMERTTEEMLLDLLTDLLHLSCREGISAESALKIARMHFAHELDEEA